MIPYMIIYISTAWKRRRGDPSRSRRIVVTADVWMLISSWLEPGCQTNTFILKHLSALISAVLSSLKQTKLHSGHSFLIFWSAFPDWIVANIIISYAQSLACSGDSSFYAFMTMPQFPDGPWVLLCHMVWTQSHQLVGEEVIFSVARVHVTCHRGFDTTQTSELKYCFRRLLQWLKPPWEALGQYCRSSVLMNFLS